MLDRPRVSPFAMAIAIGRYAAGRAEAGAADDRERPAAQQRAQAQDEAIGGMKRRRGRHRGHRGYGIGRQCDPAGRREFNPADGGGPGAYSFSAASGAARAAKTSRSAPRMWRAIIS